MEGEFATLDSILMGWFVYGLVLVRSSGLVVFAPFFGAENFPTQMRVGLAAFFALVLYPFAQTTMVMPAVLNVTEIAILGFQEVAVGLSLGLLSGAIFMAAQLAGQLAGMQIGFAMANLVDPVSGTQVSIIGFFKMNLGLVIFLTMKLHLLVIWLMYESYRFIGIGTLSGEVFRYTAVEGGIHEVTEMFRVALRLAAPILLIMLLSSTVIGFVTKTMPQMNIMSVGLPMRVFLGVMIFVFVMPHIIAAFAGSQFEADLYLVRGEHGALRNMIDSMYEIVQALGQSPGEPLEQGR